MNRFVLLGILTGVAMPADATATPDALSPPSLTILQWNVENLFDAQDDPANPGDDEFAAGGSGHWTEALYARKLEHLAEIIALAQADLVCVQEIENRRVLEDLTGVLRAKHGRDYPYIVHRDSTDDRGIDVAILARLAPVTNHWATPLVGQRDILVAQFATNGVPLTLLVNHWKSWRGPRKECAAMRAQEAAAARGEVDSVLDADANACVVVLGDFNDNCDGPSVRDGLRSTLDMRKVLHETSQGWLYNLGGDLPADGRGTLYYSRDRKWQSFDSMNVSRAMVDRTETNAVAWRIRPNTYEIFRQPQATDEQGRPKPFRRLRFGKKDVAYIEGYADHFPVRVTLELR